MAGRYYLAWYAPTARQSTYRWCPATVCQHPSTVSCSWSGCNSRQSADDGWSCHDGLSCRLLPAAPAATYHPITDANCRSDACPGFYQLSTGLLQLTVLRNCRQSIKATTVCPECSCTTNHWYATYRAYHTSLAVAPLATGQATDFVQGGSSGPQVPQRACTSLLGWW